ncbi:hypothetical protein [Pelagibius sp. Alg239-R121]|uniref:hypothetical protein n=1 Tax=Pelagibius sp. Alg239-R121 TaxID=2993448 RepID=UPI0024A62D15|nr:hypothetical protein [Pelagibius sp. Alg239-R121]
MNATSRQRALASALALFLANSAQAADQDLARKAREQGVTAPFSKILSAARSAVAEQAIMLDAVLRHGRDRLLVDVYFREDDGRVVAVTIDGKSVDVVNVSGRNDSGGDSNDRAGDGEPPAAGNPQGESANGDSVTGGATDGGSDSSGGDGSGGAGSDGGSSGGSSGGGSGGGGSGGGGSGGGSQGGGGHGGGGQGGGHGGGGHGGGHGGGGSGGGGSGGGGAGK